MLLLEMSASTVSDLIYLYNKYLIDLIIDSKPNNILLKHHLKKCGYKAIDPRDMNPINHFISQLTNVHIEHIATHDDYDHLMDFEPLKGISFTHLNHTNLPSFSKYFYLLCTIAATYKSDDSVLTHQVISILSTPDSSPTPLRIGIFDEYILKLVNKCITIDDTKASEIDDVGNLIHQIENSKLGSLAKDITSDINIDNINPTDLNISALTDPNNPINSILGTLGERLKRKIDDGEISQSDLITDACGLIGSFGKNKESQDMLKMIGGMVSKMDLSQLSMPKP